MCYFASVPKVRDVTIPRSKAIRAWKGFDKESGVWVSRRNTEWYLGVPNKATAHGFYAVVKRPGRVSSAAGYRAYVKHVLLWGRVREYKSKLRAGKHGYRAQFCMILPAKKQVKKGK